MGSPAIESHTRVVQQPARLLLTWLGACLSLSLASLASSPSFAQTSPELAMRDFSRHLRETGQSKGTNASFTRQDRSRFLQALEEAVQSIKRGH